MSPLTTKYDIADLVIEKLDDGQRLQIAETPEDELIMLHFGLGTWIRNQWLWSIQYGHLVEGRHPDDVSMDIIRLVWSILRRQSSSVKQNKREQYE